MEQESNNLANQTYPYGLSGGSSDQYQYAGGSSFSYGGINYQFSPYEFIPFGNKVLRIAKFTGSSWWLTEDGMWVPTRESDGS